MNMQIYKTSFW